MTDPMEILIRDALTAAGLKFVTDEGGANPSGLDFYLPDFDLHIEVKQFHSDRIADQMARADNVIVAQGRKAVEWLAAQILAAKSVRYAPMVVQASYFLDSKGEVVRF